jgi:hypothetical protein
MYKILHFSGGVYKFDLLAEHVEDVGGLLFQENRLHISRGASFLSEEVKVIFIIPLNEVSSVNDLASEIKGEIEELDIEEPLKSNLINSMDIYNILCKADDWVNNDIISESDEYNPIENSFRESGDDNELPDDNNNLQDNLKECLDLMLSLELVEKRDHDGTSEYRILKNNDV